MGLSGDQAGERIQKKLLPACGGARTDLRTGYIDMYMYIYDDNRPSRKTDTACLSSSCLSCVGAKVVPCSNN